MSRDPLHSNGAVADMLRSALQMGLAADDAERLAARMAAEPDWSQPECLAEAWQMGVRVALNTLIGYRTCRICGCWELEACDPPCAWVGDEDLCTACEAPEPGQEPHPHD